MCVDTSLNQSGSQVSPYGQGIRRRNSDPTQGSNIRHSPCVRPRGLYSQTSVAGAGDLVPRADSSLSSAGKGNAVTDEFRALQTHKLLGIREVHQAQNAGRISLPTQQCWPDVTLSLSPSSGCSLRREVCKRGELLRGDCLAQQ